MSAAGLIILLIVLLLVNVPIAFSIGFASLVYMIAHDISLVIVPQRLYGGADNFMLLALPLFIVVGEVMNAGGITKRIIDFSSALIGHIRGGLALVNILASMFFAGVSGSAVADTASIGAVLIPGMIEKDYPADFSAAVTASSSTIGIIIPPSNPMIIHGAIAGVSVGALFIAGFVPGILVGLGQMVVAYFISKRRGYPVEGTFSWTRLVSGFKKAFFALVLPVIILGGITSGVFTPTEAAAISVIYAVVVGIYIYRTIAWGELYHLLIRACTTTAVVMIIVSTSMLLGWVLSYANVPQHFARLFLGISEDPVVVLLLVTFLLIVAGTILHGSALQLIIVPMLLPLIDKLGVDPLLFGMVVVFCVGIGQQTPPVGSALFVTSALAKEDILDVSRENIPFILVIAGVMYLIIFFPPVATFLPKVLGY